MRPSTTADAVLEFWFVAHGEKDWFSGDAAFDARCAAVLGGAHGAAARGELWAWRETARGRLAEIILLDQISRQIFRGQPEAFATDRMALVLAQEMVAQGLDAGFSTDEKAFAYLPYQHAESLVVQEQSLIVHAALGDADYLKYARAHHEVIARFGRFPFRNAALGRESTPEEAAYMAERAGEAF